MKFFGFYFLLYCKQTLPVVEHVSLCFALIDAAEIDVSTSSRLTDPFPNGLFLYVYQPVVVCVLSFRYGWIEITLISTPCAREVYMVIFTMDGI